MAERSLTDRVLGLYERAQDDRAEPPTVSAVLEVAEAVEDTQRRLADLEEVVPPPWRPPAPGRNTFIPKGPQP